MLEDINNFILVLCWRVSSLSLETKNKIPFHNCLKELNVLIVVESSPLKQESLCKNRERNIILFLFVTFKIGIYLNTSEALIIYHGIMYVWFGATIACLWLLSWLIENAGVLVDWNYFKKSSKEKKKKVRKKERSKERKKKKESTRRSQREN